MRKRGDFHFYSFFTTLEQVNTEHGYVPIHLSRKLVDREESPITIEIYKDDGISETMTLLPDKMQDINLRPNFNSLNDTIYHYKVAEHPWIEGDISVSGNYTNGCIKELAKSLYSQRDFQVKFPSYLTEGFRTGCIAENTNWYVIQTYVNQTATDYHTSKGMMYSRDNPYPFYLYGSMPEEEVKGIVQIHAQKYYLESDNPRKQGYDTYLSMLNSTAFGYRTNPQFVDDNANGVSYLTFNEGRYLSVVDVLTND